jgi:hypothetical protein
MTLVFLLLLLLLLLPLGICCAACRVQGRERRAAA